MKDAEYKKIPLGLDKRKPCFQTIIFTGTIFGAEVNNSNSFSLVGCMVSPGFDFADFEILNRTDLLYQFPQHENSIMKFTKS